MGSGAQDERVEILSSDELRRTLMRLASQVLERVGGLDDLVLLGIPTRGVQLASVLARSLEEQAGQWPEEPLIRPFTGTISSAWRCDR